MSGLLEAYWRSPAEVSMAAHEIRVSSKGQVVVPQAVRERHGWKTGTVLRVTETDAGVVLEAAAAPQRPIADLVGCVTYRGPARTVDEMHRAIAAEAGRLGSRHRGSR
jgi:AbrB family looped-hinge helix DNA binding protein